MHFKSVIGFGTASLVTDPDAKRKAFDIIMAQYSNGDTVYTYSEADLKPVVILKVDIDSMTGKKS